MLNVAEAGAKRDVLKFAMGNASGSDVESMERQGHCY